MNMRRVGVGVVGFWLLMWRGFVVSGCMGGMYGYILFGF